MHCNNKINIVKTTYLNTSLVIIIKINILITMCISNSLLFISLSHYNLYFKLLTDEIIIIFIIIPF